MNTVAALLDICDCRISCATVLKLEALRERRPPWPRQIITPILPTVKILSLGGERLPPHPPPPPPKKKKKKKKVWDHYLHHDLGMPPLLWCFFAHLLILEYSDHHQNLISSSLYYPGPLHKISYKSVHNFLSYVVHRQTDKLTNATRNITCFAKEVISLGISHFESLCSLYPLDLLDQNFWVSSYPLAALLGKMA